jgi:hypothetical protein
MTSTRPLRRLLALGLLVPAAIGLSATQAKAAGESISLVQNDPTAVAERATNFTTSGTLNPDDTMFGFDIYVFLKDPAVDPTCAADFDTESANALHSGGHESWVSPAGGFQVGMGPAFNQPFKITFTGAGSYLLCGYVQGDFSTFAAGELRGAVTPGQTVPTPPTPTPTVTAPAVVRAPWITRTGHVLTCHAGRWSNAPTSLSYRWYAKGHGKTIASHPKLTVRRSVRGRMVSCRVTARNAAGGKTATSRAIRAR